MADSNREWVIARRDFLKTTGAVVVGFSMADVLAAQTAHSRLRASWRRWQVTDMRLKK